MNKKIKRICNESLMIVNEYTGITFSFQWSLIFFLGRICITFLVILRSESKIDRKLNRIKASIDKIQIDNKTRWFIKSYDQTFLNDIFYLSVFLKPV